MKKTNISILIFIILLVVSVWYINKNVYSFWNVNELKLTTDRSIDKSKINIYMGISVNTINRENDLDLFDDMQKYTLIYQGEIAKTNEIINEYGENDFLIIYDNQYYYSFRQFKTLRHAQHIYSFDIKKENGVPLLSVSIEGKNDLKFSESMLPIKYAEEYRCNVPKNRVGIIYNMTELVNP